MSSKTYVYPSKTYILLMGLGRIETLFYAPQKLIFAPQKLMSIPFNCVLRIKHNICSNTSQRDIISLIFYSSP